MIEVFLLTCRYTRSKFDYNEGINDICPSPEEIFFSYILFMLIFYDFTLLFMQEKRNLSITPGILIEYTNYASLS
jgi:hypothetical protein